MIKAIAIDDEPPALAVVDAFCRRSGQVQLCGQFNSLQKVEQYSGLDKIDLLFLDINMPPASGIDWAIANRCTHKVIFTTAFIEYAAEAFTINAIDYLVKPFSYERFLQGIAKAESALAQRPASPFIFVKSNNQYEKILLDGILYIEAKDDYVKIITEDGKTILVRKTLQAILAELNADSFVRIHRSFIINRNKLSKYSAQAIWIGTTEIPIGKNYKLSL